VEPVTETTVGLAVNKDKMLAAYETGNKAGKLSMVNKGTIQRSLLCKDGLHFSWRGSVQVVVDLEKDISTVRASHHAAQKRPVVSRPATPRPVVTPSEDTKTAVNKDKMLAAYETGNKAGKLSMVNKGTLTGCRI
jgi:6-phosphogluconolactonase (cycloisomerase 2 family)